MNGFGQSDAPPFVSSRSKKASGWLSFFCWSRGRAPRTKRPREVSHICDTGLLKLSGRSHTTRPSVGFTAMSLLPYGTSRMASPSVIGGYALASVGGSSPCSWSTRHSNWPVAAWTLNGPSLLMYRMSVVSESTSCG